jgi:hypothetical protein
MIRHHPPTVRDLSPAGRIARSVLILIILGGAFFRPAIVAGETLKNVGLYVISREILFFSAQTGLWTSTWVDAGERNLQREADGNMAAVVTSQRAIGFSAATGKWTDVERFQPGR